jgi:hypothetical protein
MASGLSNFQSSTRAIPRYFSGTPMDGLVDLRADLRATGGTCSMSDTTKAAADEAAQAPTLTQKLSRWVAIAVAAVFVLIGAIKAYDFFMPQMPACAGGNTVDVVRGIFKNKGIALTALSDMKLDTESSAQRNCLAHIQTASETGTISSRITMQGRSFQVLITKVDAKPL